MEVGTGGQDRKGELICRPQQSFRYLAQTRFIYQDHRKETESRQSPLRQGQQ